MKVGVDLVEVERLKMKIINNLRLEEKLFTDYERDYCRRFSDPFPHFAGTFAAKEAVIKALGNNPGWKEIEIKRNSNGTPEVYLRGKPLVGSLSISHTHKYAVAIFILP